MAQSKDKIIAHQAKQIKVLKREVKKAFFWASEFTVAMYNNDIDVSWDEFKESRIAEIKEKAALGESK